MDFGISYFPTDEVIEPAVLARMAEERGFETVFVTEHTHIPASRDTPYPAGGDCRASTSGSTTRSWRSRRWPPPRSESRSATRSACWWSATRSPRRRRSPRWTGSRAGGCCSESGPAGTSRRCRTTAPIPKQRFKVLRERVEACKEIWTKEEATYHGEFVSFDRIVCRPAPLQDPHPPVLVGGNGPNVLKRVVAFGDAWFPNRIPPDDAMIARIEELQRLASDAGRDRVPVTIQIPPPGSRRPGAVRAGRGHPNRAHAAARRRRGRRERRAQVGRVDAADAGLFGRLIGQPGRPQRLGLLVVADLSQQLAIADGEYVAPLAVYLDPAVSPDQA